MKIIIPPDYAKKLFTLSIKIMSADRNDTDLR